MSIQLKSLRLSKHDEENDMTIGARQGMGRGCGGRELANVGICADLIL